MLDCCNSYFVWSKQPEKTNSYNTPIVVTLILYGVNNQGEEYSPCRSIVVTLILYGVNNVILQCVFLFFNCCNSYFVWNKQQEGKYQ